MSKILHNLAITRKRVRDESEEIKEEGEKEEGGEEGNKILKKRKNIPTKKIKLLQTKIENKKQSKNKKTTKIIDSNNQSTKSNQKKNKRGFSLPSQGEGSSIVYLGHIPHGFYEDELRKFFSQFGKVLRLKLVRSLRTGGSRGHGFIQFESPEVAEVVSSTIDGYYLLERQLVCHIVPVEKLHVGLFKKSKKMIDKLKEGKKDEEKNDTNEENEELNIELSDLDLPMSSERVLKFTRSQSRKQQRLKELGIDFQFFDTDIDNSDRSNNSSNNNNESSK